ncbi:MAG: hypothetical protein MSG64_12725 [Pyrinomonadaceae bacterium MAG19_C2-C3]|nr:hypothetical protein [Pyrinomonadaceae bacterium MAG19_C2-C3]
MPKATLCRIWLTKRASPHTICGGNQPRIKYVLAAEIAQPFLAIVAPLKFTTHFAPKPKLSGRLADNRIAFFKHRYNHRRDITVLIRL